MTQKDIPPIKSVLSDIQKNLNDQFPATINYIGKLVQDDMGFIDDIAGHIYKSGGKHARLLFSLCFGAMMGECQDKEQRILASSVELIHLATLLHDDVVDNSALRRDNPTAHTVWGNQPTILVGDYLFTLSLDILLDLDDINIVRHLSHTASLITRGELLQLQTKNQEPTMELYEQIIHYKTASLFAVAAQNAVYHASNGNSDFSEHARLCGYYFGMIYQMIDDIIDYAPSNQSGKNAGDDFFEGKITLPILMLLQELDAPMQQEILDIFKKTNRDQDDFDQCMSLLLEYDILEKSRSYAMTFMDKFTASIDHFPDNAWRSKIKDLCLSALYRRI